MSEEQNVIRCHVDALPRWAIAAACSRRCSIWADIRLGERMVVLNAGLSLNKPPVSLAVKLTDYHADPTAHWQALFALCGWGIVRAVDELYRHAAVSMGAPGHAAFSCRCQRERAEQEKLMKGESSASRPAPFVVPNFDPRATVLELSAEARRSIRAAVRRAYADQPAVLAALDSDEPSEGEDRGTL